MKNAFEEDMLTLLKDIELDLNCVVWLTDKKHKLLSSLLNRQFKLFIKSGYKNIPWDDRE